MYKKASREELTDLAREMVGPVLDERKARIDEIRTQLRDLETRLAHVEEAIEAQATRYRIVEKTLDSRLQGMSARLAQLENAR